MSELTLESDLTGGKNQKKKFKEDLVFIFKMYM
jgi:hypothetical protein